MVASGESFGTRIAFQEDISRPHSPSAPRNDTMADKKKPTVKELPTKAIPTKDADKVKGGRVAFTESRSFEF
jgi:hypothetical protein